MRQSRRTTFDDLDKIAQHGAVDHNLAALGGLLLVRSVENMGDVGQSAQLVLALARFEQVHGDKPRMAGLVGWSPGQSDHLPVITPKQVFEDSLADDASGPSDEGDF